MVLCDTIQSCECVLTGTSTHKSSTHTFTNSRFSLCMDVDFANTSCPKAVNQITTSASNFLMILSRTKMKRVYLVEL